MYLSTFLMFVTTTAIARAAPALQTHNATVVARNTNARLTQWKNNVCGQGQHHNFENKGKTPSDTLGCKDIDAQSNSFDFALGPAKHVVAFTGSGCQDRVGVIFDTPEHAIVGNGDCVDANAYLGNLFPGSEWVGKRINSVKFE